ncbi:MAG: winged helix-turn-helix transcriptional regulator, partial [Deltaproteobacteria bacterium]|nr:winged helix-turn-helix transcriptional regulator [Deltaproteobacteria bacterium]
MQKKIDGLEIQTAAYLTSQNQTQSQIAKILEVSPSVISRALKQAKKDGWLKNPVPEFDRTNITARRMAEIEARAAPKAL